MGRSKFPGKPSKHVNRKRVNVLPPTSESVTESDSSVTVENLAENKQVGNKIRNGSEAAGMSSSVNSKVTLRRLRKIPNSKGLINNNSPKRALISKMYTGVKGVSNKMAVKKKINSRKIKRKPICTYSSMKSFRQRRTCKSKESTNLVGKFVLPTRSVHSSRVIKPNKRFINVDLSDTLTLKKKVRPKKHCTKQNEGESQLRKTQENISDSSKLPVCNNGRVVLRQARLKLHNQTPTGSDGPFSSNLSGSSPSPPGTVTCGVCGAVRFYRFVKQARKFNIFSCESCRKFISKMIKRVSCGKNVANSTLVCHKGQGTCHVPPIVRSQQMKLIKCAYRSRCPACWLKMCLRSFQMPMFLKHSLVQLLPKYMQGSDVIFHSTLPLLWPTNNNPDNENSSKEHPSNNQNETVKSRPVRFRNPKPSSTTVTTNLQSSSDVKRQKMDLKGPRVKHVCRSASIVLGQPLAVFPSESEKKSSDKNDNDKTPIENKDTKTPKGYTSENESSDCDKLPKLPLVVNDTSFSQIKKDKNHRVPSSTSHTLFENSSNENKENIQDLQNMIYIDYWEDYNADDMNENGFCIIASQEFPMPAICFLCGSAGREALLHCSLCCEPYHPFCLDQCPPINNNNKQFLWFCPRCSTCSGCLQSDRQKFHCRKCYRSYHSECFSSNWIGDDRPPVCSKCQSCKDCGKEIPPKFFSNLPFCVACYKSRRKNVCCPICQDNFNDVEYDVKVMECTKCKKWIHAKCDGLSTEYCYILSTLPESVKYSCKLCLKESVPHWKKTVKTEMKFDFNRILRLFSKNRVVKSVLKRQTPRRIFNNDNNADDIDNFLTDSSSKLAENKNCAFDNVYQSKTENDLTVPKMKEVTLLDVKQKLNSNGFNTVTSFNNEMKEALGNLKSEELLNIYHSILSSVFPWFKYLQSDEFRLDHFEEISYNEDVCDQIECVAVDSRYCSFCKSIGDGLSHLESRLLYCGQNEWVHINCAVWSFEVYEDIDGSLRNVHNALLRGRMMRCSYCKQKGATVGCCFKNCSETYHFICARTAKCHFLHDKTVYCCNHELPKKGSIISSPTEFHIRRSIFIDMSDNRRNSTGQIEKINVMVGSLCVNNLGKINPQISDHVEVIVPSDYTCTRLFWSTVDPLKLVAYKVTTSTLNSHINSSFIDKNFTVDHTLPKAMVDRKLREVLIWQKDTEKKKSDTEVEDEEEPQNGADLLSPEITDAIFEELPHELLDGISVQDIFPKLMSYEDFVFENTNNELKKNEVESLNDFDEKEPKNKILNKNKKQQRSCSLTLSCKLDNSFSPAIKKRKIAPRDNNLFFQLLQVDGNFDDSSSSECNSPTGIGSTDIWNTNISEEPVTCKRCHCTYRTQASYKRHLDACEVICTSESDSEVSQDPDCVNNSEPNESSPVLIDTNVNQQPVVISSYESFQNEIHTSVLNTQTFVTSKLTSELISVPQNPEVVLPQISPVRQPTLEQSTSNFTIDQPNISVNEPVSFTTNQATTQFCLNQSLPICVNPPLISNSAITVNPTNNTQILNPTFTINQTNPFPMNQQTIEFQPSPVTIQSLPYTNQPLIASQNQISYSEKVLTNSNFVNSVVSQEINMPTKVDKSIVVTTKNLKPKARLKKEENDNIIISQTNSSPVILQQIPTTNLVPTFMDTFQQQPGQNVQYVTTITPQINSTQPLVQLQTDNNLISLVPGVQPTMIVQQPRVMENQLVISSNGSLSWTSQPVQPVYYGYETIVQNTVMQSQQFLPSTVPGLLTANSSYSTTTQVFQTSKIEPVLDVAANSFVLLNTGQLVNPQPIQILQNTQPQPMNTFTNNVLQTTDITPTKFISFQKPRTSAAPINTNSITLPTAPFVSEQGIPTNVVTPTPKHVVTSQCRPMSRVLPMQTLKEHNKVKLQTEKPDINKKEFKINPVIKPVDTTSDLKASLRFETITNNIIPSQPQNHLRNDNSLKLFFEKQSQDGSYKLKSNDKSDNSLKLYFEKQNQDGSYKVKSTTIEKQEMKMNHFKPNQETVYKLNTSFNSNAFNNKVQIAPLKPIKSNCAQTHILPLSEKQNRQQEIVEKKSLSESVLVKDVPLEKKDENIPSILYTIETQDGFKYSSTSLAELWAKVFEAVQNARAAHNMPLLPQDPSNIMKSLRILGLKSSGLKYLIEQLPGAAKCNKYKPSFNFPLKFTEVDDEPLEHTSGCARCIPHIKKDDPYDMFGWLASRHRKPEHSLIYSELIPRRGSVNNLPMAMRFRQLKLTSKYSVGVYRSKIHRRGLFCLRDFEAGEMVIEYSGEVIRSILTDKREKFYNSKGIGCYMFRIDDNLVVDATMTGNAARFINHSCDPNCYSKVVEILGHKHIIIFALRKIICGEELTYDYKFPIEEDKIPCTCGTRRCRKFLN